jgi:hypothetical protein
VAVADSVTGPWTRLDRPIVEPTGPIKDMTCNPAFGYMGRITSKDGLNWERATHYKFLEKKIYKTDGTELKAARLERPYIYVEDGVPTVLTPAIREQSGQIASLSGRIVLTGNGIVLKLCTKDL